MFRAALIVSLFSSAIILQAQTPESDFAAARRIIQAHAGDQEIFRDDSPEALAATQQVWSSLTAFLVQQRLRDPKISAATLDHALCILTAEPAPEGAVFETPEDQCSDLGPSTRIVYLGPQLLLAALATGWMGTVRLIEERAGQPVVLWSLDKVAPQGADTKGLLAAWRTDRTSSTCRDNSPDHLPGTCGPLIATVGALPKDAKDRLRFFVDADYSQLMGATIGKQTSIWAWDGTQAELQWIDWYDFMVDQSPRTSFDPDKGILHVGQKGEFRTMFDCGSCIERPLEQRILLTKIGIEDLGTRSLVPEMDAIDNFFWHLATGKSTARLASSQAVSAVRADVVRETRKSREIDPTFYSVGMVSDVVHQSRNGAEICLDTDELGAMNITLRHTADGGYFISRIRKLSDKDAACPSVAF